jgi:hypothetical protein
MILPLSIDAYNLNEVLQYGYVVPGIGDAGDRLYGKKGMGLRDGIGGSTKVISRKNVAQD